MKRIYQKLIAAAGAVSFLLSASSAMAFSFGIGITSIDDFRVYVLCVIASLMFQFLITVAVIMFIYAGYLYVTAGDNSDQVSKAHKTIIYGVVAIIVAAFANGIPLILQDLFGISGLPPSC